METTISCNRARLAALPLLALLCACAALPLAQADRVRYQSERGAGVEVHAILDGMQPAVSEHLSNIDPAQVRAALERAGEQHPAAAPVNVYLLAFPRRTVLVDAGGGAVLPPYHGATARTLRALGVEPARVTDILLTHLHADHVGGLLRGGEAQYPNATIHLHEEEARFWLDPALAARAPAQFQPIVRAIQASLAPYAASGRIKRFSAGAEVVPGITARDAGGHTPGHTVYQWEHGGRTALFWGDLIHVAAVQLAHPQAGIRFDSGAAAASATRARWLAQAARQGWTVYGAHLPFPGIGSVAKDGQAYRWCPARRC